MANEITVGGPTTLSLKIPRKFSTDWADLLREECFLKIAEHNHGGNGTGAPLAAGALGANSVTSSNIQLTNNVAIKARTALNASIDFLKINTNDNAEFLVDIEGPVLITPVIEEVKSDNIYIVNASSTNLTVKTLTSATNGRIIKYTAYTDSKSATGQLTSISAGFVNEYVGDDLDLIFGVSSGNLTVVNNETESLSLIIHEVIL